MLMLTPSTKAFKFGRKFEWDFTKKNEKIEKLKIKIAMNEIWKKPNVADVIKKVNFDNIFLAYIDH